jgi:hypothetical protein
MGRLDSWGTVTTGARTPVDAQQQEWRLDQLLGREVRDSEGKRAGRLEEFRAVQGPHGYTITECVIGVGGLLERLGMAVRLVVGSAGRTTVARWDQIDLGDPKRPRLTCRADELKVT